MFVGVMGSLFVLSTIMVRHVTLIYAIEDVLILQQIGLAWLAGARFDIAAKELKNRMSDSDVGKKIAGSFERGEL